MSATRQSVVWVIGGVLFLTGGVWLAAFMWKASGLGWQPYGPHALGALIASFTIVPTVDRRPVLRATTFALGSTALFLVLFATFGEHAPWGKQFTGALWMYYGGVAAVSVAAAVVGASVRRHFRRDHKLLWLWISALVTLGSLGTVVIATRQSAATLVAVIAAIAVAGGICQLLAPRRMIWTCGGGAVIFIVIAADVSVRERDVSAIVATVAGAGMFVLVGALGARIAWRLFRNAESRTPTADLPTARTTSST